MPLPFNIIANADDLGWDLPVNKAILYCFEMGYINSASLMTNKPGFEDAVNLIHANPVIKNIGVHVNLYSGKPHTDFPDKNYLLGNGDWNLKKNQKIIQFLDSQTKTWFFSEVDAQVKIVKNAGVQITHLDSHLHLHTLPVFYRIFIEVAKRHQLKLRLAQTYNEGNYLKFLFRRYVNNKIKKVGCNYSDRFETAYHFIHYTSRLKQFPITEVMLHPQYNNPDELIDFYSKSTMDEWVSCIADLKK
jgi:predicted glycoside hydrolase/deacetylase ChbG (UPF0249 family)